MTFWALWTIPGGIGFGFHKMFTIVYAGERLPSLHPAGHFGGLGNGGDLGKSAAFHGQNAQKRLTINGKSCKMETRKNGLQNEGGCYGMRWYEKRISA